MEFATHGVIKKKKKKGALERDGEKMNLKKIYLRNQSKK